jgi:CRISPR-associated DxTHG motif protein
MRKIITFLGVYIPIDRETKEKLKTSYLFNEQVYQGYVFPEALIQFTEFDQMLVFVTKEAKAKTWPTLEVYNDSRIVSQDIPTGKNTSEMWQVFDKIIDCVDEGDTLIFDITHGFRSTPFLVFLFAAFLKFARNVKIEAVYYGALELGNPREGIPAPVFDLSEFVNMLDWLTATERFIATGDGASLTQLLRDEMPPGVQMGADLAARQVGNSLKDTADSIEAISRALRMVRPHEIMEEGAQIASIFKRTQLEVAKSAKPFEVIADTIAATYEPFGLSNCLNPKFAHQNLKIQLELIGWYLNHQQVVQANLLMREWLISACMALTNTFPLDELNKRFIVEDIFRNASYVLQNMGRNGVSHFVRDLFAFPDPFTAVQCWQQLSGLRNDIAHCGMRQNARRASDLIARSLSVYQELTQLSDDFLS